MYKIGAVGDRDSVLGFLALGFEVAEVRDGEEAAGAVHMLAANGCAVIFITEKYAEAAAASIEEYKSKAIPAVITVPGAGGRQGVGMAALKSAVECAVGADILFK